MQKGILSNFRSQTGVKKKLIEAFTKISTAFKSLYRSATDLQVNATRGPFWQRILAGIFLIALWPFHRIANLLVWSKVRANLGGRLKVIVSGGSKLSLAVETFFDMLDMNIIVGYGLTETSPTITSRYIETNVLGSVGTPVPKTSIKVVDVETRKELPKGQVGLILAKGPSVMAGYIRNEAATNEAIDGDGFFNTGDLGRLNFSGDLVITGRAKDTIVLSNGENVAPEPIEQRLVMECPLIDQAVLVGQDRRYLAGLFVLSVPELVAMGALSESKGRELAAAIGGTPSLGIAGDESLLRREETALNNNPLVTARIADALAAAARDCPPWEKVMAFHVLLVPFSISSGVLTQTLKVAHHFVPPVLFLISLKNLF